MPTAFLAPPARQKHTGPDQLLHLTKLPVAGSSQHLISNKKKLVSQQDITALPLPPVTVPNKRVTKVITPLTHPEDRSSDSDSSWSTPSSSGASSYQPSSSSAGREEEADDHINARAGQAAAAKQATEFTKELKICAGKPLAYQAKSTALQLPAAMPKDTAEMVQVCPSPPNSISNSLVVDYVVCFVPQTLWCNAPSLQYILHFFAGLLCSPCLPAHSFSTHALPGRLDLRYLDLRYLDRLDLILLACSFLLHSCIVAGQTTRSR